jgi:TolA-binding protein
MLYGEIAYRKGDYHEAFAALRTAVKLDDQLNYDEPWGWMQPARHALGALLLEQGNVADAELVFRADLKRHPKNPWALRGLEESLRKQGRSTEADVIGQELEIATRRSDVKIDRACFCKLSSG